MVRFSKRNVGALLMIVVANLTTVACEPPTCLSLLEPPPAVSVATSDIAVLSGITGPDQAPQITEDRLAAFEKVVRGGVGRRAKLLVDVVGNGPGSGRATVESLAVEGVNPLECKTNAQTKVETLTRDFEAVVADKVDGPVDVLSALSVLASNLDASAAERGVDVVIMSSMLNGTPDLPLDDPRTLARDPDELVASLTAAGRLSPCPGWRVYVVGTGRATDGNLDGASFIALHVLYDRLFESCGGELWRFSGQLLEFPSERGPRPPDETRCASLVQPDSLLFDSGSAELRPGSEAVLEGMLAFVAEHLDGHPGRAVEVVGHTDSDGDEESNAKLSEDRANAVKAWLLRQQSLLGRVTAGGHGEERPVAAELTPEDKAKNRRVEVNVLCERP